MRRANYIFMTRCLLAAITVGLALGCEKVGTFLASEELPAEFNGYVDVKMTGDNKLVVYWLQSDGASRYDLYLQTIPNEDASALVGDAKDFEVNNRGVKIVRMPVSQAPETSGKFKGSLTNGESMYEFEEVFAPNQSFAVQVKAVSEGESENDPQFARVLVISAGLLADFLGCEKVEATGPNGVRIDFTYPEGAERVTVLRDGKPIHVATDPVSTFFDRSVSGNTYYEYNCVAEVGDEIVEGESVSIKVPDVFEDLSDFKGCISAVALGSSEVQIEYEFPEGVDSVSVFRTGIEIYTSSGEKEVTKFLDTGLAEGLTYSYRCYANKSGDSKLGSQTITVTTLSTNPPTFSGIESVAYNSPTSVSVSWGVANGVPAEEYRIYAAAGDTLTFSESELIATQQGALTQIVKNLGDEVLYTFGVLACSAENSCSGYTTTKTFTLPDSGSPSTVGATSVGLSNSKALIAAPWQHSQGAVSIRQVFYRSGGAGPYVLAQTFNQTHSYAPSEELLLNQIDLSEGQQYEFYIIDTDPSGNSNNTNQNIASFTVDDINAPAFAGDLLNLALGTPKDSVATVSFEAITSQPADANGASKYLVYLKEVVSGEVNDACIVGSLKATLDATDYTSGSTVSYDISGLSERKTYSVCVKARDAAGNTSAKTQGSVTTEDVTAPVFNGAVTMSYNTSTLKVDISFAPSVSTDLKEYKVDVWKGAKLSPTTSASFTVQADPVSMDSISFEPSLVSLADLETVWAVVQACDNAAPTYGSQNCTSFAASTAVELTLPDMSPPAGFQGINTVTQSSEGTVTVSWLPPSPLDYTGYKGFVIYDNKGGSLVELQRCACSANNCPTPISSCDVAVDAYRNYDFHVRAYDLAGNITNYSPVEPASGSVVSKLTLDETPPSLLGNVNLSWVSNLVIGGAPNYALSWTEAGDNQYESSASVVYDIYRKEGAGFTDASDPEAEISDPKVAKKFSVSTTYTDGDSLTDGVKYYYTVCARDASGNQVCDGTVIVRQILDSVAPTVGTPVNTTNSGPFAVNFSVYDAISAADDLTIYVYRTVSSTGETPATSGANLVATGSGADFGCSSGCSLANQTGPSGLNYINYVVVVEDEAGNVSSPSQTLSFQVDNRPVEVYSITRDTGSVNGGKRVYITGIKFADGMTVALGGVACTDVKVHDSELASCTTGAAGAGGPAPVIVTNSGGVSNPDVNVFYNYVAEGGGSSICDDSASWGASFASGDGSGESPYYICNETHLQNARSASNKNYKLADNIHLTTPWTGGERLNLSAGYIFTGDVDSNGDPLYRVSGLNLAGTGYNVGFFGLVYGIISNVALIDFVVTGTHSYVGGFVGYLNGATASVKNVRLEYGSVGKNSIRDKTGGLIGGVQYGTKVSEIFIRGVVVYGTGSTGGLIGRFLHQNNTVTDIDVNVNVVGTGYVGGVFGEHYAGSGGTTTISNIKSSGTVIGSTSYIGGISGVIPFGNNGTVNWSNIASSADVSATAAGTADYIGGLFGSLNSLQTINDCRFTGTVWGDANVAGFVAHADTHTFTVNNCYVAGDVTGLTSSDVIGDAANATFSNVFFDTETTGHTTSSVGDATGKTTAEMQTESTFTDVSWDFSTIWEMPTIPGYPKLQFESE